jgi:hypothetical protein
MWSSSDDAWSGRKSDSVNDTIILGDDQSAAKPKPHRGPLRQLGDIQSIVDHIYAGRSPSRILSRVSLGPGFYTAIQRNLVAHDGNMNVVSLDLSPAFERILNAILISETCARG